MVPDGSEPWQSGLSPESKGLTQGRDVSALSLKALGSATCTSFEVVASDSELDLKAKVSVLGASPKVIKRLDVGGVPRSLQIARVWGEA
eukprot:1156537-Prorocentrum_minimum.AAC.1